MTTTAINHHPSAELLVSYSAGATTESQALCIATHLEFCDTCRRIHQRNNAIGGALVERLDQPPIAEDTKARVLAQLDRQPVETHAHHEVTPNISPAEGASVPRVLQKLIPGGFDQLQWKFATTSVRNCALYQDEEGSQISLLRIKAGGKVGKHRHLGDEYTVILTGSYSDEDGLYRAGDFILRDSRDQHTPVATKDAECICLTVQEAPLQFTRGVMRLFNPFLRRGFSMA